MIKVAPVDSGHGQARREWATGRGCVRVCLMGRCLIGHCRRTRLAQALHASRRAVTPVMPCAELRQIAPRAVSTTVSLDTLEPLRPHRSRQHKSVVTTAADHDITCYNHNEKIPCGLRVLDKTQSRGVVCRLVHFGSPPHRHRHRQRQPVMCLIRQEQASTARRSPVVAIARARPRDFFGASDPQSRAVTRKAEPRDPPNAECTGIDWTCIGGYI